MCKWIQPDAVPLPGDIVGIHDEVLKKVVYEGPVSRVFVKNKIIIVCVMTDKAEEVPRPLYEIRVKECL